MFMLNHTVFLKYSNYGKTAEKSCCGGNFFQVSVILYILVEILESGHDYKKKITMTYSVLQDDNLVQVQNGVFVEDRFLTSDS